MKTKKNKGHFENRVLIRECREYDRRLIRDIVHSGMDELGYSPMGNVFVKPNVVIAFREEKYGTTAFTNPEFLSGAALAISQAKGVNRVDIGENSAIGFPTRMCYKNAGYYKAIGDIRKESGASIRLFCIDEEPRDMTSIGGYVHNLMGISRKMARADSKVYLPKLKCHCVTTMTGAVKLNVGICCDDNRSIRHDFMLNDKIVDLLAPGYPDFIAMDAIDVGVGNEGVPFPRKLGLIIMGRNPVAVDIVGAHLLGYKANAVPYLKRTIERGYLPSRIEDIRLMGDITSIAGLNKHAKKIQPYDDEFTQWQDIHKELKRLECPIRFYWGKSRHKREKVEALENAPFPPPRCMTGCIMGLKMYLGFLERHAGPGAFKRAKPVSLVIGRVDEEIDAGGSTVILIGSCAKADIVNAKKIKRIDNCFVTSSDLSMKTGSLLGIPNPLQKPGFLIPIVYNYIAASLMKLIKGRYSQDIINFIRYSMFRRL